MRQRLTQCCVCDCAITVRSMSCCSLMHVIRKRGLHTGFHCTMYTEPQLFCLILNLKIHPCAPLRHFLSGVCVYVYKGSMIGFMYLVRLPYPLPKRKSPISQLKQLQGWKNWCSRGVASHTNTMQQVMRARACVCVCVCVCAVCTLVYASLCVW